MDDFTLIFLDVIPLLLIGGVSVVWALWIHWRAPSIPEENVPFLCFRYARYYDWFLYIIWGLSLLYKLLILHGERVPQSGWWALHRGELVATVAVCLIPVLSLTLARVLVYSLFARYPNTTWKRGQFLLQGIWMNIRILIVVMCLHLFAFHDYSEGYLLHIAGVIGVGIASLCIVSYYLTRSLGIYKQQLGEGEVYDAVRRIAALAEMQPGVNLFHNTQCPLGKIFSPDNMEVDISDVLLATLTRDEFDAFLLDSLYLTKRENQDLVGAGTIGIGFVGFWGSVLGGLAGLHQIATTRKRGQTPLSTLEQSVDGEALIRALIKVQRLKNTVGGWLPSERKFISQWTVVQRIQESAHRYGVNLESVNEQLAREETTTADYYSISGGEDVEDLLRPSMRNSGSNIFLILALILPLLPALGVAVYQSRTGHFLGADYWLVGGNILAGTVLLYILQNYLSGVGEWSDAKRRLESEMRDAHSWDSTARYVSLCPRAETTASVTYGREETWDGGYVSLQADALSYYGDKLKFSLTRSQVKNVHLTCKFPGIILPMYAIQIDFRLDDDGSDSLVSFVIRDAGCHRMSRKNRETEELFRQIVVWHQQDAAFQPATSAQLYPEPRDVNPTSDVGAYQPVFAALGMLIFTITLGVGLSWLAGLPSEPLSASTTGVLIASLAFAVIFTAIYMCQELFGVRILASLHDGNLADVTPASQSIDMEEGPY